eukprot:351518-Chlamydomonas_euryale.AAC.5
MGGAARPRPSAHSLFFLSLTGAAARAPRHATAPPPWLRWRPAPAQTDAGPRRDLCASTHAATPAPAQTCGSVEVRLIVDARAACTSAN